MASLADSFKPVCNWVHDDLVCPSMQGLSKTSAIPSRFVIPLPFQSHGHTSFVIVFSDSSLAKTGERAGEAVREGKCPRQFYARGEPNTKANDLKDRDAIPPLAAA
mmetsp:Transcript_23170/g.51706  ORF Transcript_23170/g.51706 Transcript_23170/m.51706 type:complete len:106 (-) Transcript_23170:47-364(-)